MTAGWPVTPSRRGLPRATDAGDGTHRRGLLGPLADIATAGVTDVLVNGPGNVWVDGPGGLRRATVAGLDSEQRVRSLAVRLAAAGGRRLDEAAPHVDVRVPGDVRVHAVLPALSRSGTLLSLRFPRPQPPTLTDLAQLGSLSDATAALLADLGASGEGFVVTGPTGGGKTTVLAATLAEVPADQRIVVVEDSAELRVRHPHAVYLEARPDNAEGVGAVRLDTLVRQALRMRPDRLVVGEVRGPEVRDLLSALTSGHAGATTLHTGWPGGVVDRVSVLAEAAGLDPSAALRQLRAAVPAVVHVDRRPGGGRGVRGVWGWGRHGELVRRDGTVP